MSVVAFHDAPLAAYVQPPLTTVRMPLGEMATLAVKALLDRIGGKPVESHVIPTRPTVIVRASTGPPG